GPLSISAQVLDLLLLHTSARGLKLLRPQDILIQPDISKYSSTSFTQAKAIMQKGEEAARALVERLRTLSIPEADYARYSAERTSRELYAPRIDFVQVTGVTASRAEQIEEELADTIGKPLEREVVEKGLETVYQSGEYQRLTYELEQKGDTTGIVVQAKAKEWLKNYFRVGFALEDDFDGSGAYSLAAGTRLNDLNQWGAYGDLQFEIGRTERFFAELYQPIGEAGPLFIAPEIALTRAPLTVRQNGDEVARYQRESAVLGLKAGVSFGRFGEFRTGWYRGPGRLDRDIGEASLPEFDYDIGEITSTFVIDQFDNPDFPTSGYRLSTTGTTSRDALGSSDDFEQVRVSAGIPLTVGRNTLLLGGEYGGSSSDLPVERSYSLGGMFDISGFEQRSLTADNYWIGRAMLYHRFVDAPSSLLSFGGYLGGTFEFASLQTDIDTIGDTQSIVAGSVFIGAETPLLPVYLSFGMADESERAVYLSLGRLNARRR
ncbi:MAG: BamA/TamA family outer membrane protein, partial [Bdellovibrionales bacterium]|nr:BamA/TamA family outer membrane protein [Bdellovibrionales bacterium]